MLELARHGIVYDEGLWFQEDHSLVCCTAMRGFGFAVRGMMGKEGWGGRTRDLNNVQMHTSTHCVGRI